MISVIITTHNRRGKLVKRAIESVLVQTYQDFEIIVIDDASTDNTEEIVKSFNDGRIRYFKRKKSRHNHAIVKNKGIRESKGEYIAFLDGDNAYRPDHLQSLLNVLEKEPKVAVAYGDRMINYGNKKNMGIYGDYSLSALFERNYIDTSDSLIRKEALYYIGGWDERYKRFADWNLYLRLGKAGYLFKRVPQVITDYYITNDAISKTTENEDNPMHPVWSPHDLPIRMKYLSVVPEVKVAVFTITYDRLKYTKEAFKSLQKTARYSFDHYVVDNGSTDGTQKWLQKKIDKDKLILNEDNKGISIASNQALELIKQSGEYDCILKFDNDCMCLTPGWLAKMVEIYKSNHLLALSCYVQGLKDNPGGAPRLGYGVIKDELIGMTTHLGGICHFVASKAYEKWRWPEDEQLHGIQDLEFSRYLIRTGYQMGYLENFFVNHGPMGTEAQKKDFEEYFERRKEEKVKRYGTDNS